MPNEKSDSDGYQADNGSPTQPKPSRTIDHLGRNAAKRTSKDLDPALAVQQTQTLQEGLRRITRESLLRRRSGRSGRATGPRTKAGKERSRYNALKHGIFSKTLVAFPNESMVDFELLLGGFCDYFQPQGAVEELLVEKLAVLAWRYRRLLAAETAEIQYALGMAVSGDHWKLDLKAAMESQADGCLISSLRNSSISCTKLCISILKDLQEKIQQEGLNWERDLSALMKIYGRGPEYQLCELPYSHKKELLRIEPEPCGLLAKRYRDLTLRKQLQSETTSPIDSPSDHAKLILELIAEELGVLEQQLKLMQKEVEPRIKHRLESPIVPPQEAVERLQRYEVTLDRAFDRTLSQLERVQRMRLGQPVAPPIQVNLSQ